MSLTALDLSLKALQEIPPAGKPSAAAGPGSVRKSQAVGGAPCWLPGKPPICSDEFGAKGGHSLFGSLAAARQFYVYSDIDLAVRGIAPEKFFSASAAIERVDVSFQIDLVELETARRLCAKISEKRREAL